MKLTFHIVEQNRGWLLRVHRTEGATVSVEERNSETLEGACAEALLIANAVSVEV